MTEATTRGFCWNPLIAHILYVMTLRNRNNTTICEWEMSKVFETENYCFLDLAASSVPFGVSIFMAEMAHDVTISTKTFQSSQWQ